MEQSVIYTVRDQGRRITVLTRQLLEKTAALRQREVKQVEKTILKLDFEKRRRDSRKQQEEILRKAGNLLAQALKNHNDAREDIGVRRQLVQANDPQNILEKGFTLTLDESNRVIKTLKEFEQKERAILKFRDGAARVKIESKKEET